MLNNIYKIIAVIAIIILIPITGNSREGATGWCTSTTCPGGCAVLGCDLADCSSSPCECSCSCGFKLLEYQDEHGNTQIVWDIVMTIRVCAQS